jgi:hypothetical protein
VYESPLVLSLGNCKCFHAWILNVQNFCMPNHTEVFSCFMWCHGSHFGGAWFISLLQEWLSRLRYFMAFLSPVKADADTFFSNCLDVWGSIPGRARDFSLLHSIQTDSGATHPPIQWVPGDLSPGVKQTGHEAEQWSPSSAKVKNGGAIPPLPHISLWHNAYLMKQRDNFTLFSFLFFSYAIM